MTLVVVSGAPGTGKSTIEGWWRGARRDRDMVNPAGAGSAALGGPAFGGPAR